MIMALDDIFRSPAWLLTRFAIIDADCLGLLEKENVVFKFRLVFSTGHQQPRYQLNRNTSLSHRRISCAGDDDVSLSFIEWQHQTIGEAHAADSNPSTLSTYS